MQTERPITAAIEETVVRLRAAEREVAACVADLERIGVQLRRTPEGVYWSLGESAHVVADEPAHPI